jgi:tetratricopeptide (TPR) repeat protein
VIAQVVEGEDTSPIPVARLDFSQPGTRESVDALLKLRRDLSGSGLSFPLFDYAVVTYLHKAHLLTEERLGKLFPAEEFALILEVAGLVTGLPVAAPAVAVLNFIENHLGERFGRYRLRRNLNEADVQDIQRMDHETELIRSLPRLFAEDLNSSLGDHAGPDRVTLFFDTHEAFWGHERGLVGDLYFGRDEWLRRFLTVLDRAAGAIVVVAGREPPRWSDAPSFPLTDLELHHVGDLADADALDYLQRTGIADPDLRQRLCEEARVGPDQIHPLFLGLGADLANAAARRGQTLSEADLTLGQAAGNRRRRLVDRLLRYVDVDVLYAVRAMSVCRSFDASIYRYLALELRFEGTRAGFEILTAFSFVHRLSDDRFRIHDLLRRIELQEHDEFAQSAHAEMERYYRDRLEGGEESAFVDAIYHANRVDWQRGAMEWLQRFDTAIRASRFDLCAALLEVRDELLSESHAVDALVAIQAAECLQRLARFGEARAEYAVALEAIDAVTVEHPSPALNDKGNVLVKLGDLEQQVGDLAAAEAHYHEALVAFGAAIEIEPYNFQYLSNRGNALVSLGDLRARAGDPQAAEASYRRAIAMILAALRFAPEGEYQLLSNAGKTLVHMGTFQGASGNWINADYSYRVAIGAFKKAVRLSPEDPVLFSNLSSAYHNRGRLYANRRRRIPAEHCYRAALRAVARSLHLAPHYLVALSNQGMYCEELGWLVLRWARPRRIPEAQQLFQMAIDAYDIASDVAPENTEYRTSSQRIRGRLAALTQ